MVYHGVLGVLYISWTDGTLPEIDQEETRAEKMEKPGNTLAMEVKAFW